MTGMPFMTGGVLQEWGPPKQALLTVQREIRDFNGRTDVGDYRVDLAMMTWHNFREPEQPLGVSPAMLGEASERSSCGTRCPRASRPLTSPRLVG